jgi:hypothetical protein
MPAHPNSKKARFNFRADPILTDLIHQAVQHSGEDLSDWLRTRTEKAAHEELADPRPVPQTRPTGSKPACIHPVQARQKRGVYERCLACDSTLRSIV